MLQDFTRRKSEVQARIGEVQRVAESLEALAPARRLAEMAGKLAADRFTLAVLGLYKRGKSTLINALLGAPVLPVAVLPLTSIGVFIAHGDREAVKVDFLDGSCKDAELTDLELYATERGNPGNRLRVREVRVRYPAAVLKNGLEIVDTPGVGSTFAHNTEAARALVARADAAVFVLGTSPPIGEAEVEFLRHGRAELGRLFFVLNQVDRLDPAEIEESVAFTRAVLEQTLGTPPPIFPVSALRALEARRRGDPKLLKSSGLPLFEAALSDFLLREKGDALLQSARRACARVAAGLLADVDLEQQAIRAPREVLEEQAKRLAEHLASVRNAHREALWLLDAELGRLLDRLDALVDQQRAAITAEVQSAVEAGIRASTLPPRRLARHADDLLRQAVTERFAARTPLIEEEMRLAFAEVAERYRSRVLALIEQAWRMASDLFEVAAPPAPAAEELSPESHLHFFVGDPALLVPMPDETTLAVLLPRRLAVARLVGIYRDKAAREVSRNSGRVRHDLLIRLERSIARLKESLADLLEAAVVGIERAIERARAQREAGEASTTARLQQLADLRATLSRALA